MATKSWNEEITEELLSFATENQAARLAVILECGSLAEAARRIGIHERSLYKIVAAVNHDKYGEVGRSTINFDMIG